MSSTTSSSEYSEPRWAIENVSRRSAAPGRASGAAAAPSGGAAWATSGSERPAASSWRITRSGRNSSRCSRRIVRRRETSPVEYSR